MTRQISEGRKAAYYVGMVLTILGALSFGSVFVTAALNFGNFTNFEADARSSMLRAFGGMVLMIVGTIIRMIGARGLDLFAGCGGLSTQ